MKRNIQEREMHSPMHLNEEVRLRREKTASSLSQLPTSRCQNEVSDLATRSKMHRLGARYSSVFPSSPAHRSAARPCSQSPVRTGPCSLVNPSRCFCGFCSLAQGKCWFVQELEYCYHSSSFHVHIMQCVSYCNQFVRLYFVSLHKFAECR